MAKLKFSNIGGDTQALSTALSTLGTSYVSMFNLPLDTIIRVEEVITKHVKEGKAERATRRASKENPVLKCSIYKPVEGSTERTQEEMYVAHSSFGYAAIPLDEEKLPVWSTESRDMTLSLMEYIEKQIEGEDVELFEIKLTVIGWYLNDATEMLINPTGLQHNPRYNDRSYNGYREYQKFLSKYNELPADKQDRNARYEAQIELVNSGIKPTLLPALTTLGTNPDPMNEEVRKAMNTFPIFKLQVEKR